MKTAVENHLLKADLYRILSMGFSYPQEDKCENINYVIQDLLMNDELEPEIRNHLLSIQDNIDYKVILREFSRVFLKGTIPTTETAVCEKMHCVTDVAAFYKAFGFNPKCGDSPDSIIYQLEFASLMYVKTALAKDDEQLFVVKDAYRKFMNDHLTELSLKFHEKLQTIEPIPFYSNLSGLLVKITKDQI